MSLLRCKWMIQVQQITGIGPFSSSQNLEISDQKLIAKDINEICSLSMDIENLGIIEIVENSNKDESLMQEILFEMK